MWLVWIDGCFPKGTIEGLFIHVDTGEILGRLIAGGCGGTFTGEDVKNPTNIEKTDIELAQEVQINNSVPEGVTNKKGVNENITISKNEEAGIIQKIINWIKALFIK